MMATYIIISIVSLLALVTLHELGHFLVAKKFGVKVEEFGIGIPPKICSKKFGETVFSLNLLPIGAFVNIYGENEAIKDERSFSEKTIWQRALILLGGVVAFWIVAYFLLIAIAMIGTPIAISDDAVSPNSKILVLDVEEDYPAQKTGIMSGDILLEFKSEEESVSLRKVSDVKDFLEENKGREFLATIDRNGSKHEISISSENEAGIIGVFLERIETKRYSWYQAPVQAGIMTGVITANVVYFLGSTVKNAIVGKPLPPGVRVAGPVGIVKDFFAGAIERGLVDYLQVMVMVSISLAVFNLIPIPALDGGRLLFLLIEKIKGSPVNQKLEQSLVMASFLILIGFFFLVTFYDIWG